MATNDYDLTVEGGVRPILPEGELCAICDLVLEQEGVGRPCAVSVSIVSDERMRELNRTWRDQDRATDVLSLECERPGDPDLAPGEPCELGDIVLAPSYIRRQAQRLSTTEADECRLLLVHGMLHLLGYDHLDDAEAEVMETREDALLDLVATDGSLGLVTVARHGDGE